jgi:ABC-type uncharacterized transport system substrate-binding protein
MKSFTLWVFITFGVLCLLTLIWLAGSRTAVSPSAKSSLKSTTAPVVETVSTPKKILFVHSYHQGYPWTDGILAGFVQALELSQKKEPNFWESTNTLLQNFYMDTKRRSTEENKRDAASRAKELIESWQPDIIVTSDDNALKYLVVPILEHSTVPIIFCGVNWDVSEYKLSASRVTGMIEVQPIDQILSVLQPFAHGTKVGFLKGNDLSAIKEADAFESFAGVSLQRRLVANFEEWLTAYRELQQESDILLVGNSASIDGWDALKAKQLVATATQIPTGTWDAWMRDYALVTFSTVPEEQGTWVANASRTILAGKPLSEVPVSRNQKAKIYRNMAIAKQLNIVFPMEFIRRSWAVEQALTQ